MSASANNKTSQPFGAWISGVGSALPDKVVTNNDFAAYLETSDEWITERTGIKERRIGETTGSLAVRAAQRALSHANLTREDIGFLILATSTPDRIMPPTSAMVQDALGLRCGVVDINVACTGFVTGLQLAHGLILGGEAHVLVIGADVISNITDQTDRTTAVLFGDGAGAVVLSRTNSDNPDALLASDFGSDGSTQSILYCDHGSTISMTGKEVYRQAVLRCVDSINAVLQDSDTSPSEIDLFVPHQANVRIMGAIADRVGFSPEVSMVVLDTTGNTSAASIPLALDAAVKQRRLHNNDNVLLCGFGAGMAWGTQLWKWRLES